VSDLRAIDSLRLHSDAERVPVPSPGDLSAIRASLRECGQQDPIDVTPDGVILDGRTRWSLLRDLGSTTIRVRVMDIPDAQQVAYMIGRAVARRHLTTHQKRDLNEWLRAQVTEERPTKRGNVMRIGHSQTQRAAALGVERKTVERWDESPLVESNVATSPLPTHAIDGRGRPQPLHKAQLPRAPRRAAAVPRPTTPKLARNAPHWQRHFTRWCRGVLPEDRPYLVQMTGELHKALALLGLDCEGESNGDDETASA